jgi:hypothetical protein
LAWLFLLLNAAKIHRADRRCRWKSFALAKGSGNKTASNNPRIQRILTVIGCFCAPATATEEPAQADLMGPRKNCVIDIIDMSDLIGSQAYISRLKASQYHANMAFSGYRLAATGAKL